MSMESGQEDSFLMPNPDPFYYSWKLLLLDLKIKVSSPCYYARKSLYYISM